MNSFLLVFIGLPALEVFIMIKIGGQIGSLNTISLIFLTAIIGVYFAKQQGLKTIRSGVLNLYQNKIPIFEIISGASIGVAALFLIVPGFLTDAIGFLILIPITRKILTSLLIKKNKNNFKDHDKNKILDGEIVENKKDEL